VPYRTKNCVSLVAEFATTDARGLTNRFRHLLEMYTLSKKTGMAVYTGFSPSEKLLEYGRKVKRGEIKQGVLENLDDKDLRIVMNGRGIIGAVAAIPFYTRYEEALELCSGQS
jgi:tRNA(Ile2) C34 agmatinyltransferase TiaS